MMNQYHATMAGVTVLLLLTGTAAAQTAPGLAFSVRGGIETPPDYPGARSNTLGPDLGFGFTALRFGGFAIGSPDAQPLSPGFGLRGSFRYLSARESGDNAELAGLDDVDASLELGAGMAHVGADWRVFGDLRYGVTGHGGLVGQVGYDAILRPSEVLTLTLGPRVDFGNARFNRTYFGVTDEESAASGLAQFRPDGGIISIGLEAGALYELNENWAVEAAVSWDRLQDDAERSPITQRGSADQYGARIGVSRSFRLGF